MTAPYFELTEDTVEHEGQTLYRIRAVANLPAHKVSAGDMGGCVWGAEALSGGAWATKDAKVVSGAVVSGTVLLSGDAVVSGGGSSGTVSAPVHDHDDEVVVVKPARYSHLTDEEFSNLLRREILGARDRVKVDEELGRTSSSDLLALAARPLPAFYSRVERWG